MNKHHYGSTKAAVILIDILSDKPLVRRRVDRLLNNYNTMINDIVFSNMPGSTKIWALNSLVNDIEIPLSKLDYPISTLSYNVCKGTFKTALMKVANRGDTSKRGIQYKRLGSFKQLKSYEDKQAQKDAK